MTVYISESTRLTAGGEPPPQEAAGRIPPMLGVNREVGPNPIYSEASAPSISIAAMGLDGRAVRIFTAFSGGRGKRVRPLRGVWNHELGPKAI
jgi:hypothetical protein